MQSVDNQSKRNRITASTYSQIPNVIFDYWMKQLNPYESLLIIYLCRMTFGWHREKVRLSLATIVSNVNFSKDSVIDALKILIAHGLVKKTKNKAPDGSDLPNTYEIIVHEIDDQNIDYGVANTQGGGVANTDTNKERDLNKEENRQTVNSQSVKESDPVSCLSVFSDDERKSFDWMKTKNFGSTDGQLTQFAKTYPLEDIKYCYDVAIKNGAEKIGAYVSNLLKKGIAKKAKLIEENREWVMRWQKEIGMKLGAKLEPFQEHAICHYKGLDIEIDFTRPEADVFEEFRIKMEGLLGR